MVEVTEPASSVERKDTCQENVLKVVVEAVVEVSLTDRKVLYYVYPCPFLTVWAYCNHDCRYE